MISRSFGKLLDLHCSAGFFWIRVPSSSRGFYVKKLKKHPLVFSERHGYAKGVKLGRWYLGYLPPSKIGKYAQL